MKKNTIAAGIGIAVVLAACSTHHDEGPALTKSGLDRQKFKTEYRGDSTQLFTLTNANGMEACITNFGARVVSLMVPDKDGNFKDVVLGFDSIQAYFPENNLSDFGAAIGRYANRIAYGNFTLDGEQYNLPVNNGLHSLHGGGELGKLGWQYRVFSGSQPNDSTVVLTIQSPDDDNGYPGNVTATVTYTLRHDNALAIGYTAETDKPTVINMTNHSYFNLNGDPTKPITNHILNIDADKITPVDSTLIPTGTFMDVKDTPFELMADRPVSEGICDFADEQIKFGNGFDHNFVLNTAGSMEDAAAELVSPETGIILYTFTDEPGIQVYTGNFLDGSVIGKNGVPYNQHAAICLETQHYPDSPNKPQFPSTRLDPGQTYKSTCIYKFDVKHDTPQIVNAD